MKPRSSSVVRVVLSLCLALNGFGAGTAAHAHGLSQADANAAPAVEEPASAATPTGDAAPACHGAHAGHSTATSESTAQPEKETDPHASTGDRQHGCCDPAGCGGSCLHQPTGPVSHCASALSGTPAVAAVVPRAFHAAPALPHLTRPPIG